MNTAPIIHQSPMNKKAIAITFDDGPHPVYTPQILDIFREAKSKATFYMVGQELERFRQIAEAVHEEGHEIGNHTYSHPYLTKLNDEQILSELVTTDQLIQNITGKRPATFRPPYLDYNAGVYMHCEKAGYKVIGAMNLEAKDWANPGVDHIVKKTREQIAGGSILLFHDGYGDRSQTVESIRVLVPEIVRLGYQLVTVSELLA